MGEWPNTEQEEAEMRDCRYGQQASSIAHHLWTSCEVYKSLFTRW